jgi:hypothetical protein
MDEPGKRGLMRARTPEEAVSRRDLFGRTAVAVVALVGASGCKKKVLVCDGLPDIAPADVQLRTTLEYVDHTPQPDRACVNCTLYVAAPEEGTCGACKVVHGPIHPLGTCKIFLRKPEGGTPT